MYRRSVIVALYLVATLLAYHNCFNGPFVFDDAHHIVENKQVQSLWPIWPLLRDSSRPLVQLSVGINYAISGLNTWSYHLFNVFVHLAAACVLNAITRRILEQAGSGPLRRAASGLAFTIALLWTLHPLQTSSVTYIIQRGESLMGLFCLLTLYCFIRSVEPKSDGRWRVASVACCILGLASKPTMAVAPLLVLLYDRIFVAQSVAGSIRARGKYYAALFGTLTLLPVILSGKTADWAPTAGFGNAVVTPLTYAGTQPKAILHYLRLAFWPDALCLDYGWAPEQDTLVIAASTLALATLAGAAVYAGRRSRLVAFAAAWFFVTLAPTSSFIPIADVLFEHRMYLALAAVAGVTVAGAFLLTERAGEWVPAIAGHRRCIRVTVVVFAVLLLTGRTVLRNDDYASDVTLWTSATQVSPQSARAHYSAGTALMARGRWTEAVVHLEEAVRLRPGYADAHYNLGNARLAQGKPGEAVMSYRRALSVTPDDWQMHNNLGVAMLKLGDIAAARREFERTLELKPDCSSARSNLDKLFESVHRPVL